MWLLRECEHLAGARPGEGASFIPKHHEGRLFGLMIEGKHAHRDGLGRAPPGEERISPLVMLLHQAM